MCRGILVCARRRNKNEHHRMFPARGALCRELHTRVLLNPPRQHMCSDQHSCLVDVETQERVVPLPLNALFSVCLRGQIDAVKMRPDEEACGIFRPKGGGRQLRADSPGSTLAPLYPSALVSQGCGNPFRQMGHLRINLFCCFRGCKSKIKVPAGPYSL